MEARYLGRSRRLSTISAGLSRFSSNRRIRGRIFARFGVAPTYPANFAADVLANRLPQVSWVIPNVLECEHPALPAAAGAFAIVNMLKILLSNPAVWEKTALIVMYDEHGGLFGQVIPPTPPPGTPGEYLTVPDINAVNGSGGIRGPIGLGFRVPCVVISPFSRGPLMCHDAFDHTSQLHCSKRDSGCRCLT